MPEEEEEPFESESFDKNDYVPVFFAKNIVEAEEYCELLSDHDIPARAGLDEEFLGEVDPDHHAASRRGMTHGVPVLVPEVLLDEASEVIADREDLAEFEGDKEEADEEEDEEDFGIGEVAADDLLGDADEEEELIFGDADADADEEEEDEDDEDDKEF